MSKHKDRIYYLKGSPYEMGYAMGQFLGSKLATNIEHYAGERMPIDAGVDLDQWRSGALPWLRGLPARFVEEFEGIADGAGLPLQRLAEWEYLEAFLGSQCSGAILRINNHVWVARNNDFFVPELSGYATIREPNGRIPSVMFGLQGDLFTPTGINQESLWLHYNYLPVQDAPPERKINLPPYAFMVEALETCRSLNDLESLLDSLPRDDSMLLFAVDGKADASALYECNCRDYYKVKAQDGWLVGTNHWCMHPKVPVVSDAQPGSSTSRYARMERLVEDLLCKDHGASPVKGLIRILADDEIESRGEGSVTSYANVACPSTKEIWFTFGGYPAASHGDWQRLDWPW